MIKIGNTYKVQSVTELTETENSIKILQHNKGKNGKSTYEAFNIIYPRQSLEFEVVPNDYIKLLSFETASYSVNYQGGKTWVNVSLGGTIEIANVDLVENKKQRDEAIAVLPF